MEGQAPHPQEVEEVLLFSLPGQNLLIDHQSLLTQNLSSATTFPFPNHRVKAPLCESGYKAIYSDLCQRFHWCKFAWSLVEGIETGTGIRILAVPLIPPFPSFNPPSFPAFLAITPLQWTYHNWQGFSGHRCRLNLSLHVVMLRLH